MIVFLLGAGFSLAGNVPLAGQLFDRRPDVDRVTRKRMVDRVVSRWLTWKARRGGAAEEYLAELEADRSRDWLEAQWYVGLAIAMPMGRLQVVGGQMQVTRHTMTRTTGIPSHEMFWTTVFRHTEDVAIVTTNYDILVERGLRIEPRPRVPRPGFHYGTGSERLLGGGYPSYAHIQQVACTGRVPVYKLHGSVSWSEKRGEIIRYHDCRPAICGDALIVAPMKGKVIPRVLSPTWEGAAEVLAKASTWIIVGYSLPEYDLPVRELLTQSAQHRPTLHVADPDPRIVERYARLLPECSVTSHPGIPEAIPSLSIMINASASGIRRRAS